MTLIAAGQGLRRRMNQSLGAVADIEQKENALRKQLDMAERQQETSMLATGAGLGASYGLKALAGAKGGAAAGSVATPTVNLGRVAAIGQGGGGSGLASTAPKLLTGAKEGASLVNLGNVAAAGGEAAGMTPAILEAASGAAAAGAGSGAAGAGAATTGAGAATAGAAGGGGIMAGLSALAAPVAIGLGVAALLNKLFD